MPSRTTRWPRPSCSAVPEGSARPPAPASWPRPSTASTPPRTWRPATNASHAAPSTTTPHSTFMSWTPPPTTPWRTSETLWSRCASPRRLDNTRCISSMRSTCSARRLSTPSSRPWRSRRRTPSSSSPPRKSTKSSPPSSQDAKSLISRGLPSRTSSGIWRTWRRWRASTRSLRP